MISQELIPLLFGAGVGYVPEFVFHSRAFWLLLVVVIVGILLYHNIYLISKNANNGMPKVSYSNDGRSGHVWYQSHETEFTMYYEFGGGDCVASIDIPGPEDWTKHTGLPLARREEVLDFIGRQVVKDQTTGGKGRFKIEGNWLNVYVVS